jgi:hypothetical protein
VQREDTVFRALADPSRRAIFERLTRGDAAVIAHAALGDDVRHDVRHIVTPLVLSALVVASWALRPESRRLKRA